MGASSSSGLMVCEVVGITAWRLVRKVDGVEFLAGMADITDVVGFILGVEDASRAHSLQPAESVGHRICAKRACCE